MDVASVVFDEKMLSNDEMERIPRTVFSLSPAEKMQYLTFQKIRQDLEASVREMSRAQITRKQQEVQSLFLDIVAPYLRRTDMVPQLCFAYYGGGDVEMQMRPCALVRQDHSFLFSVRVDYSFDARGTDLSCTSRLACDATSSHHPYSHPREFVHAVIWDLFKYALKDRVGSGMLKPALVFDHFISFGSTDHAFPLLQTMAGMLEDIPQESLNDLCAYYREWKSKEMYGSEQHDSSLMVNLLRKEYERSRTFVLAETGLASQRISLVPN